MKCFTLFLLFLLYCPFLTAQYIEVDDTYTAQQLVEDVLINSPCANVSNFTVSGWDAFKSYGYFNKGTSNFPFDDGVLITTGRAVSAIGPNTSLLSEGSDSWTGDTDLEQAIGESNTINATVLEFDFLPLADKVTFEYIFSSEQYFAYNNPSQCNFSDGFAFLLRVAEGQNQYQNLAVVPGTNVPVKITTIRGEGTICPSANTAFFDAFNGSQHPTNYNGQTTILKAEAVVQPGLLYHMKLVVADQGNAFYDSAIFLGGGSFSVDANLGVDRLTVTGNALCFEEAYELDALQQGNNQYQWFRNGIVIPGETNPTYTVTQEGTYSVEIIPDNSSCLITGEVRIEYNTEIIAQNAVLIQCEENNSGIGTFNLFDSSIQIMDGDNSLQVTSFHTSSFHAENNISPIPNATNYINTVANEIVFARVVAPSGCVAVAQVRLNTVTNFLPPLEVVACSASNNPDVAVFNLNETTQEIQNLYGNNLLVSYHAGLENALTGNEALPLLFLNTEAGMQTIYARLENDAGCFGIIPIYLTVLPSPQLQGNATEIYCLNTFPEPIILSSGVIGDPSGFSFLWSTGATTPTIPVNEAGSYTVTVSFSQQLNGQSYTCSSTKTISVLPSESAQVSFTIEGDYGNQTIVVTATGGGDYLYALDNENGPYQESPVFENVKAGKHIVYVLDLNGCGIVAFPVYVINFPNYFTPNNDGVNDYWQIVGLDYKNLQIERVEIFDRFGKILHVVVLKSNGWDGTFKGKPMPSSDYWFKAFLSDGGIFKGHFTLKR